uniref:PI3K/PI4K domain-containing protein n=1 Tax=Strongyloides papillosus TaxID=174720 RepID=A0A0N5BBV0_STREA
MSEEVPTQFINGGLATYRFTIYGREIVLKPLKDSESDLESFIYQAFLFHKILSSNNSNSRTEYMFHLSSDYNLVC